MLKILFDLSDFEEVEIVPLADIHIGSPLADISTLKDTIEYINEEPANDKIARICLLNGDLTESVTRKSVGDIYNQVMSPQLQVATITEMLKPLTVPREHYPMGKILSYCGGNHDTDRYKDTGITAAESIAVNLGLEDRYSPNGCYSFIKLKRIEMKKIEPIMYTVYNQHLTGAANTIGGKANRLERVGNMVIADLICGAHTHVAMGFKEDIFLPYGQKATLTHKTITYVNTGSFLKHGDYAEKMGMKPSPVVVPKIYVKQLREKKKMNEARYFVTEVHI